MALHRWFGALLSNGCSAGLCLIIPLSLSHFKVETTRRYPDSFGMVILFARQIIAMSYKMFKTLQVTVNSWAKLSPSFEFRSKLFSKVEAQFSFASWSSSTPSLNEVRTHYDVHLHGFGGFKAVLENSSLPFRRLMVSLPWNFLTIRSCMKPQAVNLLDSISSLDL